MNKLIGSVLTIDEPVPCPYEDKITEAIRILNNQSLAIYQILYANGFAKPGNTGRFRISRDQCNESCGIINSKLRIIPKDEQHKHYSFYAKTPEEALEKVQLVNKAIEKNLKKCDPMACCPLATFRPCVCVASFTCTLHGQAQCHGSHG